MVVSDLVLGGLTKAMEGLTSQIKGAMTFAMNAEKASLALGMTFEQTNNQLGGTMEGLRGDMNQRFAAGIAGMEAGLQGNTAGIARLVNQQRLTGTQSAKTAKVFAQMEMTLDTSRDATNNLAAGLPELGATWQVSTDLLVGAIDTLAKSFPAQKLAGMGTEVTKAFTTLTAELGPSMKGPMDSVMSMIMDTSMDGYEKLTKLGIGNVREQLSAAKSSAEAQKILKDAIAKASGTFKDVVGDASDGFFKVGVASEIFGDSAIQLTAVQDAFGKRTAEEGEQAAAFGDQLGVIKDEIMIPLQKALLEFFPIFKSIAIVIGGAMKDAISFLVERAKDLYVQMGGLTGVVDTVKQKFYAIKDAITENIAIIKIGFTLALTLITAKLILIAATILPPIIVSFGLLAIKLALLLLPVIAIAAPFVALGYVIFKLNEKFKIWDTVVGVLSKTFNAFKDMLGSILLKFNDLPLIGGFLGDFGESLKESAKVVESTTRAMTRLEAISAKEADMEKTRKAIEFQKERRDKSGNMQTGNAAILEFERILREQKNDLKKLQNTTDAQYKLTNEAKKTQEKAIGADAKKADEVKMSFDERLALDRKNLGLAEESKKNLEEINAKTPEIATTPEFLDQTANMLGRSIEGILGVGRDTTAEEMLEELREANLQRAKAAAEAVAGGSHTDLTDK